MWGKKEQTGQWNEDIAQIWKTLPVIDEMGYDSEVCELGKARIIKKYSPNISRSDLIFYQELTGTATILNGRQVQLGNINMALEIVTIDQVIEGSNGLMYSVSRLVPGLNLSRRYGKGQLDDQLYRGIEDWLKEMSNELVALTGHRKILMIPYNAILNDRSGLLSVTDICRHLK